MIALFYFAVRTRSVDLTISNILGGAVTYIPRMDSAPSVSPVNTLAQESKNIPSTSTVVHTAASSMQVIYCQAFTASCWILNVTWAVRLGRWSATCWSHWSRLTGVVFRWLLWTKGVIDCRLCALNSGYLTSVCVQNTKEIPSLHYIWTYKKANWAWDLLFWDVTQQRLVVGYWCFGTTYSCHLQECSILLGLLDPWRLDR